MGEKRAWNCLSKALFKKWFTHLRASAKLMLLIQSIQNRSPKNPKTRGHKPLATPCDCSQQSQGVTDTPFAPKMGFNSAKIVRFSHYCAPIFGKKPITSQIGLHFYSRKMPRSDAKRHLARLGLECRQTLDPVPKIKWFKLQKATTIFFGNNFLTKTPSPPSRREFNQQKGTIFTYSGHVDYH